MSYSSTPLVGANTSFNFFSQIFPFASWAPVTQSQLVVPSSFHLKGLSAVLIQPQLFSQTRNVSSWLFLRGLHQVNTALPVAPSAQSADL